MFRTMRHLLTSIVLSAIPTLASPKTYTFPLQTHSTIVNRRLREGDSERVSSLYQGSGTHYVDLWVGSPEPQRQTVVVDTGSRITAFPCKGCVDCAEDKHLDHYYNFEASETFSKLSCEGGCELGHCVGEDTCETSAGYLEGSTWKAFAAKDVLYPGGNHDKPVNASVSFEMNFGCETSITGYFKTQLEAGIMGMGQGGNTMWQLMYKAGKIDKKMFSLCYVRHNNYTRSGTLAGAMTMGGFDDKLWKTPVVYAAMSASFGYDVTLKGVYLWNSGFVDGLRNLTAVSNWQQNVQKIDIPAHDHTIVDSGTTSTYLNPKVQAPFEKAWNDIVGAEVSNEFFEMTDDMLMKVPTVLVRLGGTDGNKDLDADTTPGLAGSLDDGDEHDVLIAIPPLRYITYFPEEKKYKSKIFFKHDFMNLIGANAMAGHDVIFDIDNKRLGFAESDCSYE